MPNLLSRSSLEAPKLADELYVVANNKDYRITLQKLFSLLNASMVGLDKVENTADLDKPISNAVREALTKKLSSRDIENLVSNNTLNEAIDPIRRELERIAALQDQGSTPNPNQPGQPSPNTGVTPAQVAQAITDFWLSQKEDGGDFKALETRVTEQAAAIATNSGKIDTNIAAIQTNKTNLDELSAKVQGLKAQVDSLPGGTGNPGNPGGSTGPDQSAAIAANAAKIGELTTRVAAAETEIGKCVKTESLPEAVEQSAAVQGLLTSVAAKVAQTDYDARVTHVDTELNKKVDRSSLTTALEAKVDTSTLTTKVQELNTAIEAKVSQSTYDTKVQELEDSVGSKVAQNTYDTKVQELETKIQELTGKITILEGKVQALESAGG